MLNYVGSLTGAMESNIVVSRVIIGIISIVVSMIRFSINQVLKKMSMMSYWEVIIMEYPEDEYLNISGLQHFVFCRRQWALIHIEQQWAENYRTIAGEILHERAHDSNISEKRKNVIISRGLKVSSRKLGINGVCDVVEFHESKTGISLHGYDALYEVCPIEYKKGEPKEHDADILQLCAQAICLEEMLACDIKVGYLYYGECKHRYIVQFTDEVRERVIKCVAEMHEYYKRNYTPKVKRTRSCNACSINQLCIPQILKGQSVNAYIDKYIEDELN